MKKSIGSKDLPSLTPEKRREVITAAYLRTQCMINYDIGSTMFPGRKSPESKISGLIALAKQHGFLREVINPAAVSPDEIAPLATLAHGHRWNDIRRQLVSSSCSSLKTLTVGYSSAQEATSNETKNAPATPSNSPEIPPPI